MSNSQFGFYSKTAAKQFGSFLYKMEDGSEQEITSLSLDKLGSDYQFKDKKYIGIVSKFIQRLQLPPTFKRTYK